MPEPISRIYTPEEAPYGLCPVCGLPGHFRERRPDGNDGCLAGHTYPSRDALALPSEQAILICEGLADWLGVCARNGLGGREEWESLADAIRMVLTRLRDVEAERDRLRAWVEELEHPRPRPFEEWHEDIAAVALWWTLPVQEPPYCGSPLYDDWPWDEDDEPRLYWTPIVLPAELDTPATEGR